MLRHSTMIHLGTAAPSFELPDAGSGRRYSLQDFSSSNALLIAFICNHCPFVKHLLDGIVSFARDYQPRGLAVVAISANDIVSHPEDAPEEMARLARERGFTFPYLYDESQRVALAYEAICTPDFFLFDRERKLAYRGQFDASRPHTERDERANRPRNMAPVTGRDLRAAADAVLREDAPPAEQIASVGCSIKWKRENEPTWTQRPA